MPSLDASALYGLLCLGNPIRYFEIGSGNSTKFARRAIHDYKLRTTIVSIDPVPRTEIDQIWDSRIRQPLEDIELKLFDELEEGDILFVGGSHRVFMNPDVAVMFLEVLPRLRPGVLVQFHDVFLPYDYYTYEYEERKHWSEQYLLACYLLAEGQKFQTILPNQFITQDPELNGVLSPIFDEIEHRSGQQLGRARGGTSFWIRMD